MTHREYEGLHLTCARHNKLHAVNARGTHSTPAGKKRGAGPDPAGRGVLPRIHAPPPHTHTHTDLPLRKSPGFRRRCRAAHMVVAVGVIPSRRQGREQDAVGHYALEGRAGRQALTFINHAHHWC